MEGKYRELHRLLLWRQLDQNWDPRGEFPVEQPLYLEIGFGNGEYLLRQAQERPQHNFLGIEMHWGSVRRCLRRLAQAGSQNVRILQMDAQVAVRYLLPDQSIEQFVALFPCPWPKRDHERFRLFSTDFMGQLNRICRAGGLVVTDHRGLMEFARAQVAGSGLELEVIETEARYNTKYERRWSGQGQEIFFELHYRPQAVSSYQQMAEVPVQTLILDSLDPDKLVLEGCQDGLVVQFRQQLFDPKKEIFMTLVTVVEDHLSQTFWIEAARKDGQWHIRPALGGGFLPTLGVQRALELVQKAGQAG
ncbi:MAG: hypothetical protein KF760_22890 [Candidatus Eremiobacteraeota bacterium]|nr:hypothetical protein [Candidatus Eremiobacteraeota bacterium]MCW5868359.1 hypothetical protein [Candidatus Eremiobacteraeota bacterium]